MSALEKTTRSGVAIPAGARPLGQRKKPVIRLGMGIKDPNRRGAPKATDYLTVRGNENAVAKFKQVYGERPFSVKIMLPSALELALEVGYRAFIGGQEDGDGRVLAMGVTNFATLGYVGGPDVLRVWDTDGEYRELETLGLDELGKPLDAVAEKYGIEIYTTFTFTIPDVLGYGSTCEVTSKGKKTADNLTLALTEIYSTFGHSTPWAFNPEKPPLLVLRPDSAMRQFEKDGQKKWSKTPIHVLDIVIPEAFQEMANRLIERRELLAIGGGAANELYGSGATPPQAIGAGDQPAEPAPAPAESDGEPEPELDLGPTDEAEEAEIVEAPTDEDKTFADAAGMFIPPNGQFAQGGENGPKSLSEILALGEPGVKFLKWALGNVKGPDEYRDAVWRFCKVYLPEQYASAAAKRGEQS